MFDEKRKKLTKTVIPTNDHYIIHITKDLYPIKISVINILFHQINQEITLFLSLWVLCHFQYVIIGLIT